MWRSWTVGWVLHALRCTLFQSGSPAARPSRLWTLGSNAGNVDVHVEH